MKKAVLISIRPQWCELIAAGEKTIEVRKSKPKLETPFKCYIYCTKGKTIKSETYCGDKYELVYKGSGKVIGEFVCDLIKCFDVPYPAFRDELDKRILQESCLTYYQLHRYAYHDRMFGWHISELKIYDTPQELSEFKNIHRNCWYAERDCAECKNKECFITRPPQSWCYVEEK